MCVFKEFPLHDKSEKKSCNYGEMLNLSATCRVTFCLQWGNVFDDIKNELNVAHILYAY